MKEKKINDIVNQFFDSLKSYENPKLQTGLTQHETIDLLKNDESDESEYIEEQLRNMQ